MRHLINIHSPLNLTTLSPEPSCHPSQNAFDTDRRDRHHRHTDQNLRSNHDHTSKSTVQNNHAPRLYPSTTQTVHAFSCSNVDTIIHKHTHRTTVLAAWLPSHSDARLYALPDLRLATSIHIIDRGPAQLAGSSSIPGNGLRSVRDQHGDIRYFAQCRTVDDQQSVYDLVRGSHGEPC